MAIKISVANEQQVKKHELQLIDVARSYYGLTYQTHKGEVTWNPDMAGGIVNLIPDTTRTQNQYSKKFIIQDNHVFLESISLR